MTAPAPSAASGSGVDISPWLLVLASLCGVWYFFIALVQAIGFTQLYRHYSSQPKPGISPTLPLPTVPHITILRPVKGLEPQLYECLAATFHQTYPREKLTIYLCVASAADPALPVLHRLLLDHPRFDAKVLIEAEDPNLAARATNLGPNPKIRNMSRGYREAKGDLIWIIDCNVWVGRGAASRMVDKLCGYAPAGRRVRPYKFVHLLPLVVDSVGASADEESRGLLVRQDEGSSELVPSTSSSIYETPWSQDSSRITRMLRSGGGRLEEMFMASSHAKFYTAINTVSIAPCIVGKSNMFRRSHLDALTSSPTSPYAPGIDFFSENICEDHLIGDLLWRKRVPGQDAPGDRLSRFKNHGLVFGDLAIQPMAGMSVAEYAARRVRWLRVRKWTVTLATLVEPGVEPLLCSSYGAFALTTHPWLVHLSGLPPTWSAFLLVWLASVTAWMSLDYLTYSILHACASVERDDDTPSFARPTAAGLVGSRPRRPPSEWIAAWIGRELLAWPIWAWACLGGTTVRWRGQRFRVGLDMRVTAVG